jgi:hypothetical protein
MQKNTTTARRDELAALRDFIDDAGIFTVQRCRIRNRITARLARQH